MAMDHVFVILATDKVKYADLVYNTPKSIQSYVRSIARGAEKVGQGNSLAIYDSHSKGEYAFEPLDEKGPLVTTFGDADASASRNAPCYLFKCFQFINGCASIADEDFDPAELFVHPKINGSAVLDIKYGVIEKLILRDTDPFLAPLVAHMCGVEQFFNERKHSCEPNS